MVSGSSHLLAELIAEAIRRNKGAIGVLVRDVPAPDPSALLTELRDVDAAELPLRVAYVREGGDEVTEALGLDPAKFATTVEQAEVWRNARELEAMIVVVAHGDEAKLSSLEDFTAITSRDLKDVLVDRALGGEAGENEVQTRWWGMLRNDPSIGLGQMVDYYLSLSTKTGAEFLAAASREIDLLGLLPDPGFFDSPSDRALHQRLEMNRDVIRRLQTLTPRDRRSIADVVNSEEDPEVRRQLAEDVDRMEGAYWGAEGVRAIPLAAAERLIKARTRKKKVVGTPPVHNKVERVVAVAAESLVDLDRESEAESVLTDLVKQLQNLEDVSRRPEKLRIPLPDGSTEATTVVRQDVLALVSRLLDDGIYGGLVEIDEQSMDDILRRFDVEEHLVRRWERPTIRERLANLTFDPAGQTVLECFEAYDVARAEILPLIRALTVEPLATAASTAHRPKLLAFIAAYENLNRAMRDSYEPLFKELGSDAAEVLSDVLLLEIIIVRSGERTYAIAAPTHPLYLWHFAKYCEVVSEQRDRLDERDKSLVAEAAGELPNFLTSVFVPPIVFGTGSSLPFVGRLGPLPYFGEGIEANSADDGQRVVTRLIESYVALEPHARFGLRIALVNPPDAGTYLKSLAVLHHDGILEGTHLMVYRRAGHKLAIELRLDEDDEDRVSQVFRAVTPSRRFTFETAELAGSQVGPPANERFHLVVVFDCSEGRPNAARPALHPIQPLAVPRRIHYRALHKTVELEPAPGGIFFSYDEIGHRLSGIAQSNYLSVHQDQKLRTALNEVAWRTPCMIVADRQVDRDLALGTLRIASEHEGERDVAAFVRSTAALRRPLRDVARLYNTLISDTELDGLLAQLSELLEGGVIHLRPDATGRTNHNRIKGLLGTLIAARWFKQEGHGDRLLVSLDSEEARRWLRLTTDALRADLVAFEWTNDHCTVSVIEVKAVDSPDAEYSVTNGEVTGAAIRQMLATRRLLTAVFASNREDELITTPARREIIREHLCRELTKGSYTPEERKSWSDRLQRLLDGSVPADIRCHLIDVRLGVDRSSLKDRSVVALDGEAAVPVRVTQLNEREIEVLRQEIPVSDGQIGDEGKHDDENSLQDQQSVQTDDTDLPVTENLASKGLLVRPSAPSSERSDSAASRVEQVEEVINRPRALLGTTPGTYGKSENVWFDPNNPTNQLPNPHILITGETGSGKTQATKAILSDTRAYGIPPLILDFKDDYSEQAYADAEGLHVYDPVYEPLPFNPLTPPLDRRSGKVNPVHHIHQLGDIIKRIYGLGDQQTYRLREAIKRAYEASEIPSKAFEPIAGQRYPTFNDVGAALNEEKAADTLLGRLSPIFDLGLFDSESDQGFADIMSTGTVVRLGQLPGDETKNSVAEFFLMALYNFLIRQPQTHTLGRLLVLDEAWRLVESPFLEPLMREGRAFGLGVLIASQFPKDLPDAVTGSTATKLFFSQTQLEQIRGIQRTIVGKTSGPEADHIAAVQRGLAPLTCILHSKQFPQFLRITIKPYFERRPDV